MKSLGLSPAKAGLYPGAGRKARKGAGDAKRRRIAPTPFGLGSEARPLAGREDHDDLAAFGAGFGLNLGLYQEVGLHPI